MSFSRSDRNGAIIIGAFILGVVIANAIVKNIELQSSSDFSEIKSIFAKWEIAEREKKSSHKPVFFDFDPNTVSKECLDTLSIPSFVKRNLLNYRKAGGFFKSKADVRKIYGMNDSVFSLIEPHIAIKIPKKPALQPKTRTKIQAKGFFDPNSVSVAQLKTFGFSNYQANNLVNYRNKGGVFKTSTDVLKIYGIDTMFYSKVKKYIVINDIKKEESDVSFQTIVVLELNTADANDLVKLNGIGFSYAKRIIKYRTLLGGFYSKEQLKEVYHFPEETYNQIRDIVRTDTLMIAKLRINFCEYTELLKHPYFTKKHVKALLKRRETHGAFKNISELLLIDGFDEETVAKITPYITCR